MSAQNAGEDIRYTIVCPRCGKLLFRSQMIKNMQTKCPYCNSKLLISVDSENLVVAFEKPQTGGTDVA